ncbi:14974_t:CDS:2, partial [Dentiscutata heterogama]
QCYNDEDISETFKCLIFQLQNFLDTTSIIFYTSLASSTICLLNALQIYLDDPEVIPNLNPNNINYYYSIVNANGSFYFIAMASMTNY